jgi:predicted MFS family arabinose efflux permease
MVSSTSGQPRAIGPKGLPCPDDTERRRYDSPVIEPGESEVPAEPEAPGASLPTDPPLGRNRDFLTFLFGQGLSSLGDSVTFTALPILVLLLTGSGLAMGLVGVLGTLPDLLLGLPAGALADRWDRRKMMLGADLGRAVLTATIPLSAALGLPTMTVVVLVAFPINCLRVLWLAAYTAAVPGLVGRSQVGRAQAILEAVFNTGFILGPAIAGILSAIIGPAQTIAFDAASFVVSAGALFLIDRSLKPPPRPADSHVLADIREGVAFVVGHPVLRQVIAFWGLVAIGTGGIPQALTYNIQVDRSQSSAVLGLVLSSFGVGALGGALVAGRLMGGSLGRLMLIGMASTGGLLIFIAVGPPIPIVAASAFLAGVSQSIVFIAYITLRTGHSPDALLGRVGSTARLVSIGLTPVGLLVAGIVIDAANGAVALGAMGTWMLGIAIAFLFSATVRGARAPAPRLAET